MNQASYIWALIPLGACLLDRLLGDPVWLFHPVIWIGQWISAMERFQHRAEWVMRIQSNESPDDKRISILKRQLRTKGCWLTISTILLTGGSLLLLVLVSRQIHIWLQIVLTGWFTYQFIATQCLIKETKRSYQLSINDDLQGLRKQTAKLVGRSTEQLKQAALIQANVETLAENLTDGVVAPFFWYIMGEGLGSLIMLIVSVWHHQGVQWITSGYWGIGGVVIMGIYKAVNTLDSMVGYLDDRYRDYGRCSAKLDDWMNFVPARIAAGLLLISTLILKRISFRHALYIFKRDRWNHLSPNCAQTESVVAGALGIRLGGTHVYYDTVIEKPTIGDSLTDPKPEHIDQTIKMVQIAAWLMCGFVTVCLFILLLCMVI